MSDYESKVKVTVDDSELDSAKKKIDSLNGKKIKTDAQVSGRKNVDSLSKSFDNANKSASSFGNTVKGFAKFGAYFNIFQMIERGAKQAVEAIREVDSVIVDLQNATGSSYSNIKSLISEYNSLAKELGATTTEMGAGADNWLRQGKSIAETNTLLKDSMVLSKVARLDSEESTKYLTAISKGYKKTVDEVSSINDSLTSIDLAAAVSSAGLAEATSRVSATAELAGIELNRLLGYEAAIGEASQEDMAVIGNSLKTIFTRMSDIKSGKLELIDEDGTVETLSDVETILTNIGVPLRNSANEFRDFDDVLDDTAKKWENLSSVQRAAVSKAFAGTRQSNRFQLLMENYDKALNYEKIANSSVGTAQKKFEENYLNSLEAKQKSLQASFESLSFNLISRDAIGDIYDATSALVEFADKSGLAKVALAGLATGATLKGLTALTSSIVQASSKMNNFKQALDLIKVGNLGTNEVDKLGTLITGLSQSQQKAVLSSKSLTDQQRIQALMVTGMSQAEAQAAVSTMGLSTAQGTATATTTTLSGALKGLFATIASNPLLMFSTVVMGTVTAYQALQAADKKFGLSYSSSLNLVKDSATSYDEAKQAVDSLNSELETTQSRISELQGLKDAGTISIAEEAELAKLREQNELLESQIQIKQKLMDSKAKETAEQAQKTLAKGEQSVAQQVAQNVPGGKKTYQGMVDNVGVVDAVKEDVKAIKDYEDKIAELEKKQAGFDVGSKKWKQAEEDINSYNKAIQTLTSDLDSKQADLTTLLKSFSADGEGTTALSGYEEQFNAIKDALNSINNIDLTPTQQQLASIESFFDGSTESNSIKEKLLEAVESGESATDALHAMGITLNDLGITGEGKKAVFDDYFSGLIESAKEAEEAINSIDGSVEGVKTALDSENQNADWSSMAEAADTVAELYKNGQVGTDDFKAFTQFMSKDIINPDANGIKYDADAYVEAYKAATDKIKRYFDSENPLQSVANFSNDLVNNGLATQVGDDLTWSFKSSAEAADKLGLSVDAVEVLMHNLEAYGAEFDEVMWSGEGLERYQSALEGIKTLYDSIEDEDSKERLKNIIDQSELDDFENNLENLTEDQIIKIEFEYDLATIQQQIDELQKQVNTTGGTTEEWGSLNASKMSYRNKLASDSSMAGAIDDGGYKDSISEFESLTQKLKTEYKELGEDGRREIQQQQSALLDFQNAYLDMFSSGEVASWEEFLGSDNLENVLEKISEDSGIAKEELENLFNIDLSSLDEPKHIKLEGEFDPGEIEAQLDELSAGSTITFNADVDGVESEVQVLKNEDGTLTYSADIEGVQTQLLPMLNQDGTVTYIKVGQEEASDSVAGVNYNKTSQEQASDSTAGVGYEKTSQETPSDKTAGVWYKIKGVIGNISNFLTGGGGISGTAHPGGGSKLDKAVHGKAYLNGTLDGNSWLKDDWKTQKDNIALTGEVGQEMVVNPKTNTWRTVGDNGAEFTEIPKGSIVFDAKQTKDLLSKGHINSRGRALASGTAYANGFRIPSVIPTSTSTKKSYSSKTTKSSKSKNNTNVSKTAQTATKVTESFFDFVEILLDRTKEVTERLTDSINDAVGLSNKMSANSSALSQIQNEISVNQQAYDKYIAQANSVGLSESYASQIRNGSLNIENITDEDLKKKIDDYKKWFEEAKKCEETIRSLQKDEKKLALDRLKYIEDYYDTITKLNKAYQDVNNARIEFNDAMGSSAISNEVRRYLASSLQKQEDSYNKAIQQLADYQNETNELIANGYLQKDSVEYYDAMKTIQEFTKQVAEAATAVVEMSDKIRELDYTKLQQIIDMADRRTDQLKNKQSLAESRDQLISRDELQGQVDSLHKSLTTNYELREKKLQEQGLYDVTSTRYQELAKEIADIDGEIYGSLEDIEDIKNKIFENEFFNYEKEQDNLEYFISELEDFSKLLNEDAYFDKTGAFTDEAYTKIALVGQAISKSKQEISNATEALKKLNQMVESGLITQSEYDDKQHDLLDTIRSSVSATDDYKNELLDLYREQMQKENDYLQKNIEKRKEALKAKADYYDYDKKIKSSTKDINSLKAQIAVLEGTTNASSLATLKKLKADLAEKEESLADTKREHSVDMQEQGYNTLSDELNQALEDTEYEIAHSSEKQLSVVQSMLNQMVNSYSEAYSKINSIISGTGFIGTTDFNNTVENVGTSFGASSIAGTVTQDQSSITPNNSASGINPDNITNDNHSSIESEIAKAPNTDNRPVAELKVTPTSVTLEEGKSTTVTTSIRPTDAKNKTLSWGSSDLSIATVSNGTIKAIKPGLCKIVISTTDGSGISVTVGVTVTKKPDPPKPTPPPSNNSGGDGVARVGDVVTLKAGQRYFYDSWGQRPAGNLYAGVPKGVVIDSYSGREYGGGSKFHGGFGVHIKSADGRYGNLGWVSLDQLEGYATGDRNIDKDQLAWTQEQGEEIIVRKSDGAILTPLNKGDTVFNNKQVQRLWDVSNGNFDLANYVNFNTNDMLGKLPDVINRNDVRQSVTAKFDFDTLLTINGNPKEDVVGELRTVLPQLGKELTTIVEKGLRQDATKGGFKRRF